MKIYCSYSECLSLKTDPKNELLVRNGTYFRKSDGQCIPRFRCLKCRRSFSSSRLTDTFGQKKRKINYPLFQLLVSGVSQRRSAMLLKVNRKTVSRKLRFLGICSRAAQDVWLKDLSQNPVSHIQFDDLETSEHSKCKPLSVALAVEPSSRKILGFQVSQMPAKGHLAAISRKRYGMRKDERMEGWNKLFSSLVNVVTPDATFLSDENPHYVKPLKKYFPNGCHQTVQGQRGCVSGQGELKKIGNDPLFSLNHTCAMLRANLNRLFRRTWCTTKTRLGLIDHLSLYVWFHNQQLTNDIPKNTQ